MQEKEGIKGKYTQTVLVDANLQVQKTVKSENYCSAHLTVAWFPCSVSVGKMVEPSGVMTG